MKYKMKSEIKHHLQRFIITAFMVYFAFTAALMGSKRDSMDYIGWWLYNHGDYAKTGGKKDPRVKRAFDVFSRVAGVADRAEGRPGRLFIINDGSGVYARALPDGGIIITPRTLALCYDDVLRSEGDRRLAFILGHELAHLANKDFIHHEAFLTLEKNRSKGLTGYFKPPGNAGTKALKERELLSDQKGVLYAAMAGYDTGGLFDGANNFLRYWAARTGGDSGDGGDIYYRDGPRHPSFEKRLRFIRLQLTEVTRQMELFRAGLLLYQAEKYHDAAAAFREFAKIYPAREVYNNIGACYLQPVLRRLRRLYSNDHYRFRLSTAIDHSTTAPVFTPRSDGDYLADNRIKHNLQRAETYFRRAAARDQSDRASRYNLATLCILKKDYAAAQSLCDEILKINPEDIKALNNKAVAFYYYGRAEGFDTLPKALQVLEQAHHRAPSDYQVLYNLASLKHEAKRFAGAAKYWRKYLALPTVPRDDYYSRIHKRLKGTFPPHRHPTPTPPKIPGDIRLGDDLTSLNQKSGHATTWTYKLGSDENLNSPDNWYLDLRILVKNGIRILALDGTVEMIEQPIKGEKNIRHILDKLGPPRGILHHGAGNVYVYTDSGFSVTAVNGNVTAYTWFEKNF